MTTPNKPQDEKCEKLAPCPEIKVGDYVLASKYSDGDPKDHFVVGFYNGITAPHYDPPRYDIVDANGKNFRGNGFRRMQKITGDQGAWIVAHLTDIELCAETIWHPSILDMTAFDPHPSPSPVVGKVETKQGELQRRIEDFETAIERRSSLNTASEIAEGLSFRAWCEAYRQWCIKTGSAVWHGEEENAARRAWMHLKALHRTDAEFHDAQLTAQTKDNSLLRETVKSQDTELASLRQECEQANYRADQNHKRAESLERELRDDADYVKSLKAELASLRAEVERMREALKWRNEQLDKLLAHCGGDECMECSKIICPFEEPLHFHHDGCPACAMAPQDHPLLQKNDFAALAQPKENPHE